MSKLGIGLAAAAGVVVVGVLGTSYMIGGKIQDGFTEGVSRMSSKPLSIELNSYERGLFSSTAQTTWTFGGGEEPKRFKATHKISHGPLPKGHMAEVDTKFALNEGADEDLVKALNGRSPLLWNTQVGWNKSSTHSLTSPEFTGKFDESQVNWGGMQAKFELSAGLKNIKGNASFPQLLSHNPEQSNVEIKGSSIHFDVQKPEGQEFWVGPVGMAIASLDATPKEDGKPVKLQDLKLDTDTVLKGEVVNVLLNTQIQQVQAGPDSASDVALDFAFNNMDANWINQITKWGQEENPEPEEMRMKLMQSVPQLLARKPEFEIKRATMRTADGLSEFSALLAYDGDGSGSLSPAAIKASLKANLPKKVLESLIGSRVRKGYVETLEEFEQEIDEKELQQVVTENVKERIDALVQAGVLLDQNGNWTTQMAYGAGKIELNGKPVEGDSLQTLMGALP